MAKNKNRVNKEAEFSGLKSQDEIKSAIEKKQKLIDAMKNNLHPKFHELNLKAIENGYNSIKG